MMHGCDQTFKDKEIVNLISKRIEHKLSDLRRNFGIECDPNSRWCPRLFCGNDLHRRDFNTANCTKCESAVCCSCGSLAHSRFSPCANAELKIAKRKEIRLVKPCPGCRERIEKLDDNNQMQCHYCGLQWCWTCYTSLDKNCDGHYN